MWKLNFDKIYHNQKISQSRLLFYWLTLILSFHLNKEIKNPSHFPNSEGT